MDFSSKIVRGRLVRRYKRFLADVELASGEVVVAHCANPGSMLGLCDAGLEVWLLANTNPSAKLDWRLEAVVVAHGGVKVVVGVNTGRANALFREGFELGVVGEFDCYDSLEREVVVGGSRLDFLLGGDCYVEVKSVTLSREVGLCEFPDSRTVRGLKHLGELGDLVCGGNRCVLFYVVQRGDCGVVRVADDIDEEYYEKLLEVMDLGVEVLAYDCDINEGSIKLRNKLNFIKT